MNRWGFRLLAALALAVTAFAVLAAPALGLEKVKVATDVDEPAGSPNTFTYEATVAEGEQVSRLELVFPEGTDLQEIKVRFSVLEGLKRTEVEAPPQVDGPKLTFDVQPPAESGRLIQIVINDVLTPFKGGEYEITGTYRTNGQDEQLPSAAFELAEPTAAQRLVSWLDRQPAVEAWNSVKFLNAFFKPQLIVEAIPAMFFGWLMSIALVVVAYVLGIPAGLATAFMKMSKIAPIRWIAGIYINVIRGTPLFLQIMIGFFGLPLIGIRLPDFPLAVIVLAFNSAAYMAEIFRAGIQSIHKGQFEAASSLGMTYPQSMAYVIIPQTVRRVLPTMTSEFILLFKDTALLSAVGVFELMMYAKNYAANSGNVTSYTVAALYYLVLTIPLINWVGNLEEKLSASEGGGASKSSPRKKRGWLGRGVASANDPYRAGAPELIQGPEQHD